MKKAEARKYYRALRKELTKEEVNQLSVQILNQLKQLDFSSDHYFHCFLPIEKNNEINTYPLIEWLFNQEKKIVLPLVI